jgi:hypothetical protein
MRIVDSTYRVVGRLGKSGEWAENDEERVGDGGERSNDDGGGGGGGGDDGVGNVRRRRKSSWGKEVS